MNIAIRADGSTKIGLGHVMRMSALAKALSKSHQVVFFTKPSMIEGIAVLTEQGFDVLPENDFYTQDSSLWNLVILDSPFLTTEYLQKMYEQYAAVMVVDDTKRLDFYPAHILLNQNLGSEHFHYRVCPGTKLLLGSQFAILRDEFQQAAPYMLQPVTHVLITMGGTDHGDATGRVLQLLHRLPYTFMVAVGTAFPHKEKLAAFAADHPNIYLFENPSMSGLMKQCQLAVTACGSTVYELAALEIPMAVITIAENQTLLANAMEQENLALTGGWVDKLDDEFTKSFQNFTLDQRMQASMQGRMRRLFKRDGLDRIVAQIELTCNK